MSQQKSTWVNRLTLEYSGKTEKKSIKIPGSPIHDNLRKHVAVATRVLKPGDSGKFRNYLSTHITFVVSDSAHLPQGEHGRTIVSFNFKVPKKALLNSANLFSDYQEAFQKTGNHTEQVLYEYLKSNEGQAYLLHSFQQAEKQGVIDGTLQPLNEGDKRKVYAMVLDMHSSMNMCTFDTKTKDMPKSCIESTIKEQKPGKENLRSITAKTLRDNEYTVSGYTHDTGEIKADKVGLKMATRVSSTGVYYKDNGVSIDLEEPAINKHQNELVLSKRLDIYASEIVRADYQQVTAANTILKSSRDNGLWGAFNQYLSEKKLSQVRDLISAFPDEMAEEGLLMQIISNPEIVRKFPNTLVAAVSQVDDKELFDALFDSLVTHNKYEQAVTCYHLGATLKDSHYSVRNTEGVALVCLADSDGDSILSTLKGSSAKTFNQILKTANLSKKEIEDATGNSMAELEGMFTKLNFKDAQKKFL